MIRTKADANEALLQRGYRLREAYGVEAAAFHYKCACCSQNRAWGKFNEKKPRDSSVLCNTHGTTRLKDECSSFSPLFDADCDSCAKGIKIDSINLTDNTTGNWSITHYCKAYGDYVKVDDKHHCHQFGNRAGM